VPGRIGDRVSICYGANDVDCYGVLHFGQNSLSYIYVSYDSKSLQFIVKI
jgi:hypothetical protein